ncbi:endonuclease/exonuclease/phosphatase family protein [Geodermatophilus poikilotrophus]|uniref:Exodeoxyribonuclease-3 n=1 Tax=Geodermatophilus poikilotrophus TaxID=1333667 RepID=A0A1I0CQF5_9ACTN|nr:endonuclease/exonuclease/phosphatase family protein [Geodermatophilus poikilotrophus]SET21747.1 exodeoxyribonuclease-3 [Geodermatophilus poikilotrophus]
MKLATWNCLGKLDTKLPHLLDVGVDVAVLCEAKTPASWPTPDGRGVTGLSRPVQGGGGKELVVVACEPWAVTPHAAADAAPHWTLPVRVNGPMSFTLVALYTAKFPGSRSYEEEIDRAVNWMDEASDGGPFVLAGDFNSPIEKSQKQYDEVARRLERLGLVDVYRAARGLEQGEPPVEATYYRRHQGEVRGFHIDHIWLPAACADGAKVDVGDFDTWIASKRSDHVPVIADIEDSRFAATP